MQTLRIVKKQNDPQGILAQDLSTRVETPESVRPYKSQMQKLCREHGGVGLAANQAGLEMNFFLAMPEARLLPSKVAELVINPSWAPHESSYLYDAPPEGCLSLVKGQRYQVKRHSKILASWTNVQGHRVEKTLSGYAAQVFQHETDHLRGLTLEETGTKINS